MKNKPKNVVEGEIGMGLMIFFFKVDPWLTIGKNSKKQPIKVCWTAKKHLSSFWNILKHVELTIGKW